MRNLFRVLAALSVLIGFGWSQAHAAVALQGGACTAEVHVAANTSFSYTGVTVSAGTNVALSVEISFDIVDGATTPTVSSVVWDLAGANQSMVRVNAGQLTGTGSNIETWGLAPVTAGTSKTITITTSASAPVFLSACAWTGVNQTGGTTSFPGAQAAKTAATVTVTSATGDIVLGGGASGTGLSGITGTLIYNDSLNGLAMNSYANLAAGAATVNIGSGTSTPIVVGTNIKAAAGGVICPRTLTTAGAGC